MSALRPLHYPKNKKKKITIMRDRSALTQEMHFPRAVIEITQHCVEFLSAAWVGFSIFTHDRRISLAALWLESSISRATRRGMRLKKNTEEKKKRAAVMPRSSLCRALIPTSPFAAFA